MDQAEQGYVYFLAFFCRACGERHTAGNLNNVKGQMRLYVGWAKSVNARVRAHNAGQGASCTRRILRDQVCRACQGALVARAIHSMPGDRSLERKVKSSGHADRYLPSYRDSRQAGKLARLSRD